MCLLLSLDVESLDISASSEAFAGHEGGWHAREGPEQVAPQAGAHEVTGPTKRKAHTKTVSHKSLYSPPTAAQARLSAGAKGKAAVTRLDTGDI